MRIYFVEAEYTPTPGTIGPGYYDIPAIVADSFETALSKFRAAYPDRVVVCVRRGGAYIA